MPARRTAPAPSGLKPQQALDLSGTAAHAPLAARMRPQTIEEFVGQEHLIGEAGALRRMIGRGHLASMILWGPPGSGKTTLARLLAESIDMARQGEVAVGIAQGEVGHERGRTSRPRLGKSSGNSR